MIGDVICDIKREWAYILAIKIYMIPCWLIKDHEKGGEFLY